MSDGMIKSRLLLALLLPCLSSFTTASKESSPLSIATRQDDSHTVIDCGSPDSQMTSLHPRRRSKVALWKSRRTRERNKRRGVDRNLFFTKPNKEGTLITFGKPSRDRVSDWFWGTDPIQFNHPFVGMTNPYLQVQSDRVKARVAITGASLLASDETTRLQQSDENVDMILASRTSRGHLSNIDSKHKGGVSGEEASIEATGWWPKGPWRSMVGEGSKESSWRVLCFRKRVGYGTDCYERVKQAALAMDFDQGHKGIISVLPPRYQGGAPPYHRFAINDGARDGSFQSQRDGNQFLREVHASTASQQNAFPIWPGGGRRLATYTRSGPFRWLSLFAVSPISVVYEIVDQRGGRSAADDCLYSSTAFSTLNGHWLCGEERVTVLSRDRERNAPVDVEILSISKPSSSLVGRLTWPFVGKMQTSFFVKQLEALEQIAGSTN